MNIETATNAELLNLPRKSAAVKAELRKRGFWSYPSRGKTWWTRTNGDDLIVGFNNIAPAVGLRRLSREQVENHAAAARARREEDKQLAAQCPRFRISNGGPPR